MNEAYWLTNVTLDSGFVFGNERIDRTKTATYNMYIKNGIIEDMQLASTCTFEKRMVLFTTRESCFALPPF